MKALQEILLISCGGALGALSRYGIARLAEQFSKFGFPFGTFAANMLGCFLIGVLVGSGWGEKNAQLKLAAGVGFLGALTTFSTFGAETVSLATDSKWGLALGNVSANVLIGLVAVVVGVALGKKFFAGQ